MKPFAYEVYGNTWLNAASHTSTAATTFYKRGDDEPQDDGRGVREPRRPSPSNPPAAAALALPVFEG